MGLMGLNGFNRLIVNWFIVNMLIVNGLIVNGFNRFNRFNGLIVIVIEMGQITHVFRWFSHDAGRGRSWPPWYRPRRFCHWRTSFLRQNTPRT